MIPPATGSSFVGLNSYQLGNAYTEQILRTSEGKSDHPRDAFCQIPSPKTQETTLIYYQIKKELEEKKKPGAVCRHYRNTA